MFRFALITILFVSSIDPVRGSYEQCAKEYGPLPAPVYVHPVPAPVYVHPVPVPVYVHPVPVPIYVPPVPAPVWVFPPFNWWPIPAPVNVPPPVPVPVYVPPAPIYVPPACDNYPNIGDISFLDNRDHDFLNTHSDTETLEMTAYRLAGMMPPQDPENIAARYDPVIDAYCFNEDYPVPFLSPAQQNSLYLDYKKEFDKVLAFTNDVSEENNRVTNERIPGMFLRMCFHDNTIDPNQPDFQTYVANSIDPRSKKWLAEKRFMSTSGADASNLICPEERYHPNNNYDQTASRVLRSIQANLKIKYKQMSYADLLHNGCNAATIYLTGLNVTNSLNSNPFTFGRKDACHVDKKCSARYPLCGPSELLPGVKLNANEVTSWFTSRGMSECLFMGLMWTHTTMDNMASLCPIKRLPCTATAADVAAFTNRDRLYFNAGNRLDYFSFFLNRGTHQTLPDTGDDGDPNCIWNVNNRNTRWPMTAIDCTLGVSQVTRTGPKPIADVIKNFVHNPSYNRNNILLCALNVLGGRGGVEGGACNRVIPTECKSNANHKFGGFYSTLPFGSGNPRTVIDPRCHKYGYHRRRTMEVSSPDVIATTNSECLDVEYDMFLVIEGAHFAGLATPVSNYTSSTYCPPIVLHSTSASNTEKNQTMEKLMVVASHIEVQMMDEETKFHLGSRPLKSIMNAFEVASVGLNGDTTYDPITNNCVAMLRNMADPLNVKLDNKLVKFITSRLLSKSADHMFEIVQSSPTLKTLYEGGNRFLKSFNKEDVLSKMINLYL